MSGSEAGGGRETNIGIKLSATASEANAAKVQKYMASMEQLQEQLGGGGVGGDDVVDLQQARQRVQSDTSGTWRGDSDDFREAVARCNGANRETVGFVEDNASR